MLQMDEKGKKNTESFFLPFFCMLTKKRIPNENWEKITLFY